MWRRCREASSWSIRSLSDEAIAANRRTADALGKVRVASDLPRFTADAINTDPLRFRASEQMFRSLRFFTRVIFDGL